MTDGQYRALVAYLNFWTSQYLEKLGLMRQSETSVLPDSKDEIENELFKCGWGFNDRGQFVYMLDDEEV